MNLVNCTAEILISINKMTRRESNVYGLGPSLCWCGAMWCGGSFLCVLDHDNSVFISNFHLSSSSITSSYERFCYFGRSLSQILICREKFESELISILLVTEHLPSVF